MTPKRERLKVRIARVMLTGEHDYHVIMRTVFPPDEFPRAWRYSSNGGPPGCAMAFGRALREMGVTGGGGIGHSGGLYAPHATLRALVPEEK